MSVEVDLLESAAVVTLRWPELRNAIGPATVREVTDALESACASGRATVILTGEGAFCSGGDLKGFAELSAEHSVESIQETVYDRVQQIVRTLASSPVPTIAAIDGPAVGLGMDLALACDMRFFGPRGWLQQGWARAGLIPGTGGAALLHRLNPSVGWQLLAEQPRLDGARCVELHLGEVAPDTAIASSLARAAELATVPPEVLRGYVELMRPLGWPAEDHFRACAALQSGFIGSDRFRQLADELLHRR